MPMFTVHEPSSRGRGALDQADRMVFVKDGFNWAAFLVPLLWLLVRRLWLVLILVLALVVLLNVALFAVGVPDPLVFAANAAVNFVLGFEAADLIRWTLARRRYRMVGVIAADSAIAAERRFFESWDGGADAATPPPAGVAPHRRTDAGIIGFPLAGTP